jgi:hypothetical protein
MHERKHSHGVAPFIRRGMEAIHIIRHTRRDINANGEIIDLRAQRETSPNEELLVEASYLNEMVELTLSITENMTSERKAQYVSELFERAEKSQSAFELSGNEDDRVNARVYQRFGLALQGEIK